MDPALEARLTQLEQAVARLTERVERLEPSARPAREPVPSEEVRATPPAPTPAPVPLRRPSAPTLDLEELLGGRVLAWLGGAAIVLGVVFFLVMAVSRGWIDEPTRVILAFLGSSALLAVGLYLYERQGKPDAAVAAVAASLAALYASLTAATELYELASPALGLGIALLVGGVGTAIAVRWASPLVGALGILGALVSPVLVGAGTSGVTLAFMAIALASATGVLLWQRWNWLAAGAFLVSFPQLAFWLDDTYEEHLLRALVVLALFWAVYVVAAIGYEVRVPIERLRTASALLLLANALLVAGAGYGMLSETDHGDLGTAWVLALAAAHVVLGAVSLRGRISRDIAALAIAVGIGLSAVGLALALDGPALVAGWCAEAALLAWVGRRTGERRAHVGTAAFLLLAGVHVVSVEAPPDALRDGADDLAQAAVAIAAFAVAALLSARQLPERPPELRTVVEAAGAAALVYLPSVVIVDVMSAGDRAELEQTPQVLLSAFWSALGLASIVYGLFRDERRFRLAGLVLLGVAIVKVGLFDLAALDEIYRVLSVIALGLLLLAGAFAYQRLRASVRDDVESG